MSRAPPPSATHLGSPAPTILHATALARRDGSKGWRGVLLRGPSGVGKSDLALRAGAAGWRLVADDRSLVFRSGSGLFARAPATISGLIEARGLGVLPAQPLAFVQIVLAIDCADDANGLERMPEWDMVEIAGVCLPRIGLFAREASAVVKLGLALDVAERRFDRRFQERI
jgi:serine kinase of HPr protein (carbohydrate metabolism regulator)